MSVESLAVIGGGAAAFIAYLKLKQRVQELEAEKQAKIAEIETKGKAPWYASMSFGGPMPKFSQYGSVGLAGRVGDTASPAPSKGQTTSPSLASTPTRESVIYAPSTGQVSKPYVVSPTPPLITTYQLPSTSLYGSGSSESLTPITPSITREAPAYTYTTLERAREAPEMYGGTPTLTPEPKPEPSVIQRAREEPSRWGGYI